MIPNFGENYRFQWNDLGDIELGRPNLGPRLPVIVKELDIGVLRVEKADLEQLAFTLTVSEDLDCSGLPLSDATVCDYDEGFIAGLLHAFTGRPFSAREVDCWSTGDRTCRFEVKPDPVVL